MKRKIILYCAVLSVVLSISCSTAPKPQTWVRDDETIKEMTKYAQDNNSVAMVTLRVNGRTIPGFPKLASPYDTASVFFEKWGAPSEVVRTGNDTWIALLSVGESYVIGWVTDNKELFGYCSSPFVAAKELTVNFSPGMPTTFQYDMTATPPDGIAVYPVEFLLPKYTINAGKETYLSWGEEQIFDRPGVVKINGLAPGKYEILARSVNYTKYDTDRTPYFYDKRIIEIKPGKVNQYKVAFPETDSTVEQGDVTIRGVVTSAQKAPVADAEVEAIPLEDGDIKRNLYYPKVMTDSNGIFQIQGIRPNMMVALKCFESIGIIDQNAVKVNADVPVDLVVGQPIYILRPDQPIFDFNINYPDKTNGRLVNLVGKTVVVTLWATWAKHSAEALVKLDALAGQDTYKDVVFLALSLDFDRTSWEKAVEKAGLKNLRQGWYEQPNNSLAFNRAIPFSFIMSKEGAFQAAGYDLDVKTVLDRIAKDQEKAKEKSSTGK
jgi:hypothetical protein